MTHSNVGKESTGQPEECTWLQLQDFGLRSVNPDQLQGEQIDGAQQRSNGFVKRLLFEGFVGVCLIHIVNGNRQREENSKHPDTVFDEFG